MCFVTIILIADGIIPPLLNLQNIRDVEGRVMKLWPDASTKQVETNFNKS